MSGPPTMTEPRARTALAWQRTLLAVTVTGLAVTRAGLVVDDDVIDVAAGIVVLVALTALVTNRRRSVVGGYAARNSLFLTSLAVTMLGLSGLIVTWRA